MIRARYTAVGAAALLAAGALTACGSSSGGSGGSGGEYQVGFNSDLSGKYSLNGVGQRDGFQAYFDYVNSKGGINGHKVTVSVTDDASDVTRGTTNTTQLMTAKNVSAVGGYILSNICGAAAVLAKAHQVVINCGSLAEDLLNPAQKFVYSMGISQNMEAGPIAAMAKDLVAGKAKPKVAIIIFASAASVSLGKGLERYAKTNGWDIVSDQSVPLTATDVSAQAAKVIAAKPDVIVGSLYDPLAISFMKTLKASGLNSPFVDYDGATYSGGLLPLKDPNFYLLSGKTLDGTGDTQMLKDYQAAAKLSGKSTTTAFFNTGYVQGLEIGSGLKACGYPCNGSKLQAALDKLDLDTQGVTSGNITYTPTNHEAVHSASFYVWDPSTNAVKVAKKDVAEGDGT